ncbi:nitrite reductase large subunit NirB [Metabacillus arenae]|uniref:NAD(P)/FAD-dependent oxidoreductase n=1 Tax=Metabacillus arenae TaxID=2771434 RepID=A0A926RVX1_9BACI|nr:nitrite reductase large subunit NirB [Metabacillus arenae]MBD1378950.1 NAD(P)/FAD-dependent oxidoreductase [Metabacillus arenae]
MDKQKLVLIGNGMAGVRCIEEILNIDPTSFEITIFGSEPHVNYNRIMLSSVLQGKTLLKDITINELDWYKDNQIELYSGETVIHIDKENMTVTTDKNRTVAYDKLILATGSLPFMLPIPNIEKEGVFTFRTIEDCEKMIESSKQYKKAIVIGGGLLGLEAASGLVNLGMEVDVVHNTPYLMQRQLDSTASIMLQKELEKQGIRVHLEKNTTEIIGENRAEGLRFDDGSELEADLIVMAAGVIPNTQLAKENGIHTNRAIVVNDYMETDTPHIYAVGECVEHKGIAYGLVKPLYEQGKVLAKHVCGISCEAYQGSVLSTQLKVSGVNVFSVGVFEEDDTLKAVKVFDEVDGVYKKIVFDQNKIVGAVLFGDTSDGTRLLDIVVKQKDITNLEKVRLLHSTSGENHSISAMANNEILCNCNNVTKGTIIEAVQTKGLTTIEQVKQCTKASGSCGGCKPLVEELLTYIKSGECESPIKEKPMCTCTALTEDEVVNEIQKRNLLTVQEVIEKLDWKEKNGCDICHPALNYYLGMIYPEFETKKESLFVNERMNAALQQDGTYSIFPQMYGGMTNAEELRRIADLVEKYRIDNVSLTSHQRLLLSGIRQEDLSNILNDLNMPLFSTNGHTVQNVKTCNGDHICQCDKHHATHLAVNLEKKLEGLTTPYLLKMGVSGCIHNGGDAKAKDLGIIRIERGWEIYIGGSSGNNVRAGELLCVASTEDEAIEIIYGCIQYYRETAIYLERTWEWMERVGLIHIREVLFDSELRLQLLERLEEEASKRKIISEKTYSEPLIQ